MNDVATVEKTGLPAISFAPDQVKLIKDTICKGADDNEFALFLYTCKHTGLNPLLRQIHAVKRWDSKLQRESMAIQTGIDGYRLIAERTKKYAPGPEATFVEGEAGVPVSATAYVKKRTDDGEWHVVAATAYYAEYVQTTKDGKPNSMWARMPHSQLSKCAEALALRRAFPNDTAGVYTDEEMGQAENIVDAPMPTISAPTPKVTPAVAQVFAPKADGNTVTFIPAHVALQHSKPDAAKAWTKYGVKSPDGDYYSTFDENFGFTAQEAKDAKTPVTITWELDTKTGKYKNILTLTA